MNTKNSGDDLIAKLKRAQAMNDGVSIKLDEIEWMLVERDGFRGKPRPRDSPPLRRADKVQISFEPCGTASVTVDDSPAFMVPPVLAVLVHILSQDTEDADGDGGDDPLVPFKSYGAIISNMTKALGREFTERALKQGIHRLRKILEIHGFAGLLQTNRLAGAYRLAVRHRKDSIGAASL